LPDGKAAASEENESYQIQEFKSFPQTSDSLKIMMLKLDSGTDS
jgi:hypothetical protein